MPGARGFTSADDKQRLAAFIRRSIRRGFCALDSSTRNKTESHYSLRSRPHDRQLILKLTKLYDTNFIVHMLYKQVLIHY